MAANRRPLCRMDLPDAETVPPISIGAAAEGGRRLPERAGGAKMEGKMRTQRDHSMAWISVDLRKMLRVVMFNLGKREREFP